MESLAAIIVVVIVLALIAPIFKGLTKILKRTKKNTKKIPPLEIKLKGFATQPSSHKIEFSNNCLVIESIGFFGVGSPSPNGRYLVGCQDFDYKGGTFGGHRSKGYGRVVLVEENKLIWQVDLQRPNDAVVANNGNVAVNDWKFGDGLQGTFYLIDIQARKFGHHTKANLDKCGFSQDGSLAWCTTVSNPDYEPDDCRTFIFSSSPPAFLLKLKGYFPPTDLFLNNNEIQVKRRGIIERYDLKGKLLNPIEVEKGFQEYILEHGSPWELIQLAKSLFYGQEKGKLKEEDTIEIKNILEKVINMAAIDDNYRAWAFRLKGELAESINEIQSAINLYRTALSYNPKVGVIRALSRLEKIEANKSKNKNYEIKLKTRNRHFS